MTPNSGYKKEEQTKCPLRNVKLLAEGSALSHALAKMSSSLGICNAFIIGLSICSIATITRILRHRRGKYKLSSSHKGR